MVARPVPALPRRPAAQPLNHESWQSIFNTSCRGRLAYAHSRSPTIQKPTKRPPMATDGYSSVSYQGRVNDDVGVRLEVAFRAGAPCAIGAMVTQSQTDGLRYKRAESKRRNCGVQVTRSFCAEHKPFGWPDVAAQNELHEAISATCGTIDELMERDTEHGTPPAPWPKWRRGAEPCNVYDE